MPFVAGARQAPINVVTAPTRGGGGGGGGEEEEGEADCGIAQSREDEAFICHNCGSWGPTGVSAVELGRAAGAAWQGQPTVHEMGGRGRSERDRRRGRRLRASGVRLYFRRQRASCLLGVWGPSTTQAC